MEISLSAPAKINLALSVAGPRDDGFHPLASWMIALDFADEVRVRRIGEGPSRFDRCFAGDAPAPGPIDWPIEKDLAYRAHDLLERHVGRELPVEVHMKKRIPAGAGLAGGSADAAATLVAVNGLFSLKLGREQLARMAGSLGCDVAFSLGALLGEPSAIATGLGEVLTPAPLPGPVYPALILPPFSCSTGAVYRAFDQGADLPAAPDLRRVEQLARQSPPLAPDAPFNDLAAPAARVQPRLAEALSAVHGATDLPVHVTGSGAGMFILARNQAQAQQLAQTITSRTQLAAIATMSCRAT